jgi:hypothetical protein
MWNILQNVQSHSIILHQNISVSTVTIMWVAYDKNTIDIQIYAQKYMIKPLGGTFQLQIKCNIVHFEQLILY